LTKPYLLYILLFMKKEQLDASIKVEKDTVSLVKVFQTILKQKTGGKFTQNGAIKRGMQMLIESEG